MISVKPPENFQPIFEVVACLLEQAGEILLLHRQSHKNQPNTWGLPAGKVETGESREQALTREIFQETGYVVDPYQPKHVITRNVRYPEFDFVYHMYHLSLTIRPTIQINLGEHQASQWVSPNRALELNLILDLPDCLRLYYNLP